MYIKKAVTGFALLTMACNLSFGAINGLPGTPRSFKEYRSSGLGGTNVNNGTPRAITSILAVTETNSQQRVSFTSITFETNFSPVLNMPSTGPFIFPIPFSFEGASGLTIKSIDLEFIIVGDSVPLVNIGLTAPNSAPQQLYTFGGSAFGNGVHTVDLTISSTNGLLTNMCAFPKYRAFTQDVHQAVKPCAPSVLVDGFDGGNVEGQWIATFVNSSATSSTGGIVTGDNDLQYLRVTVVAQQVGFITVNGQTTDIRPRKVRASDFSVIDPNTGRTVIKSARRISEQ